MFSKIWLINMVLAVGVIFFGINAVGIWSGDDKKPVKLQPPQKAFSRTVKKITPKKLRPESDYRVIVERTLFFPDRAMPEGVDELPGAGKTKALKVAGRRVVLYGVIIMGDMKTALIGDPAPKAGAKQSTWVKIGDAVGNFKVTGIKKEAIILAGGAKRYEILLYDKNNPKQRARQKTGAPKPIMISEKPKKSKPRPKILKKRKKLSETDYKTVDTPFGKIKRRLRKSYSKDAADID